MEQRQVFAGRLRVSSQPVAAFVHLSYDCSSDNLRRRFPTLFFLPEFEEQRDQCSDAVSEVFWHSIGR